MPILVAFAASLVLHVGVLLAPGWSLPFDGEPEAPPLDAVLAPPARPAVRPAPVAPPPRKKAAPKPAIPAVPVARVPDQPAVEPAPPMIAPAAADEVESVPPAAPEPAAQALPAVPPQPTFASQWPRQGRIEFEVTRGEGGLIIGRSEHTWQHDGTRYTLRAVTETTGLAALFRPVRVEQESRGGFDAAGLRPFEFETGREGKPKDSIHFEPEAGHIRFSSGGEAPFVPAVQDMLSLFYQLGALDWDHASDIAVTAGRKVAVFALAVGEVEELDTPLGPRPARPLKVAGTAAEDATEVWLDIQSRLPLRIRHRDRKGEVYDQRVIHIELDLPQ